MKRRVEPEPALGRKTRFHLDVCDEETVAEHLTLRFQPQHAPDGTARTVGGDEVPRARRVTPLRCLDFDQDVVFLRAYADHAIAPARVDPPSLQQALYQELLQQILLQIDKGRML